MRIRQRGIGQIISQKEERHAWLSAQAGQEASKSHFHLLPRGTSLANGLGLSPGSAAAE